jgi:NADPH2:quinone reductase
MRSLVFEAFGEPASVLKLVEARLPEPGADTVRVRILARPIHPSDLLTVRGLYGRLPKLPAVPGFEAVGRIEAIGAAVTDWSIGQRVIPLGIEGTWADALIAPQQMLLAAPEELPDTIACQMLINPLTAYLLLFEVLKAQPGDWVIQSAAGSALGRMLIQLAALNGVNLINVIRSRAGIETLKSAGATHIIAAEDEDVVARIAAIAGRIPVTKAIDAVGGTTGALLAEAMGYGGTLIVYGGLSLQPLPIEPARLIFRALTIKGFWLTEWVRATPREARQKAFNETLRLLTGGKMVPPVEAQYDLADFAQAIAHAERPGRLGKILLTG